MKFCLKSPTISYCLASRYFFAGWLALSSVSSFAQEKNESIKSKELKEIFIKSWQRRDISRMSDEHNGILIAGKKNEVVNISAVNTTISLKVGRQIFSKIPGVFVYDMDGSGNQINISTRGLDPHRSWEMNNRQNDVLINSDMYGYPASHYSPPLESIERVEIIRGTGSLQYGAQFGGMMNFVTKMADSTKPYNIETINSFGSYNMYSTYNAIHGTKSKFSYYAYYYRRHSDGYRKNSESDALAQFIQMNYHFNSKANLKFEFGRSKYIYHLPGPLTDNMFMVDPQMSTRSRNYFSPDIYVPSLSFNWNITPKTKLLITMSALLGKRNSVQLDAFANVPDTINSLTGLYKNRQVDIDQFNSKTLEIRLLHEYQIGKIKSKLASGIVYLNNDLHRQQLGIGTSGSDFDLHVTNAGFVRDLHFKSNNIAFFAENYIQLNPHFSISPAFRIENGASKTGGVIKYYSLYPLPADIKHLFALFGISSQYTIDKDNNIYGGFSQAYRPVIFKDIIPASTYERVDKNLKDAAGYNAELGIRGKIWGRLQYDVTYFLLSYKNRMGTMVLQDNLMQSYTFKTNIGNSLTKGLELFLQYKFPITNTLYAGIFNSSSFMNARYVSGQVSIGSANKSIAGNRLESAPQYISRNGLELLLKGISASILHSYTSSTFSDPINTITPTSNGAKGFVKAYSIWDINATFKINSILSLRAGMNNVFNKHYFTKRPTSYPGPGIWPSDGSNYNVAVGLKL